jgi:hypothetical protein
VLYSTKRKSILSSEANEVIKHIITSIWMDFEDDWILEKRCRNVKQVWATFYDDIKDKKGGSIILKFRYENNTIYNPFGKTPDITLHLEGKRIQNL